MSHAIWRDRYGSDPSVLPDRKYPTREKRATFYQRIDERLQAVAGIEAGTVTSYTPLSGGQTRQLTVEGRSESPGQPPPEVTVLAVGPRYFETIGLPLLLVMTFAAVVSCIWPALRVSRLDPQTALRHERFTDSLGIRYPGRPNADPMMRVDGREAVGRRLAA